MKKIKTILLMAVFVAFTANAKDTVIELEDNSKILGKWKMYAESAALHKEKKEVNNEWEFLDDGVLAAVSRDPRLSASKKVNVKYSIEDGVIKKQSQPGREKYESCKVVKLEGKDMVLHCKYLYYFLTRI